MPVAISTVRLEARISADLHSMLKRAAELQGRTMTDFVVSAVQDAAQRAIEQAEVIGLSLADQECFAQALLSPPQPAPALERACARRGKLLRAEVLATIPNETQWQAFQEALDRPVQSKPRLKKLLREPGVLG